MKSTLFAPAVLITLLALVPRVAHAEEAPPLSFPELNSVVEDTCVTCHNDVTLLGNLSLETFDVAEAPENAEVAEKMIRKLRAGNDAASPECAAARRVMTYAVARSGSLETTVDGYAWNANPNPGRALRSSDLNRPEYQQRHQRSPRARDRRGAIGCRSTR